MRGQGAPILTVNALLEMLRAPRRHNVVLFRGVHGINTRNRVELLKSKCGNRSARSVLPLACFVISNVSEDFRLLFFEPDFSLQG